MLITFFEYYRLMCRPTRYSENFYATTQVFGTSGNGVRRKSLHLYTGTPALHFKNDAHPHGCFIHLLRTSTRELVNNFDSAVLFSLMSEIGSWRQESRSLPINDHSKPARTTISGSVLRLISHMSLL